MSMKEKMKKIVAGALLMAICAAPAAYAAERGLLADGEIFASQKVAEDGRVLYRDKTDRSQWKHDNEAVPEGFVGAAFVPDLAADASDEKDVDQIKKVSLREEKVKAAEKKYSGKSYKKSLVLYAAMNTNGNDGDLAIQKVEILGRLLNVTVAVRDPRLAPADDSEALYKEDTVVIPLKKLPRYGSLRVRFVDVNGHGLEDTDVSLGLGL